VRQTRKTLADYYVGRQHRQDLACGCALPTLSPEVIRSDRRVRSAYQVELIKLNEAIAAGLAIGTVAKKQDTAWVILSVLVGGVTLARAVWDEALAEQIAGAVHQATVDIAAGNVGNQRINVQSKPG
jgi:TetR/AcrR family transcriptional regulator, transcriptional repressor for nem operon